MNCFVIYCKNMIIMGILIDQGWISMNFRHMKTIHHPKSSKLSFQCVDRMCRHILNLLKRYFPRSGNAQSGCRAVLTYWLDFRSIHRPKSSKFLFQCVDRMFHHILNWLKNDLWYFPRSLIMHATMHDG